MLPSYVNSCRRIGHGSLSLSLSAKQFRRQLGNAAASFTPEQLKELATHGGVTFDDDLNTEKVRQQEELHSELNAPVASHPTSLSRLNLARNTFRKQSDGSSDSDFLRRLLSTRDGIIARAGVKEKVLDNVWQTVVTEQQTLSKSLLTGILRRGQGGDGGVISGSISIRKTNSCHLENMEEDFDEEELELLEAGYELEWERDETYSESSDVTTDSSLRNKRTIKNTDTPTIQAFPGIIYGSAESLAHAKYRLLPSYVITRRVLHELSAYLPSFSPASILDVGCGSGGSLAAAFNSFSSLRRGVGIDVSQAQRECSALVSSAHAPDGFDSSFIKDLQGCKNGTFDLIVAQNFMAEQNSSSSTIPLLKKIGAKVNEGGVFVLIEPGTPLGFENILKLRELVRNDVDVFEDFYTVAPCTGGGSKECPLVVANRTRREKGPASDGQQLGQDDSEMILEDVEGGEVYVPKEPKPTSEELVEQKRKQAKQDKIVRFCSFSQEVNIGSKSGKKGRGEKFSYLVVQKGSIPEKIADDESFGRLIRAPRKKRGHVLLDTCIDGEVKSVVVSKGAYGKADYKIARKAKWGGVWEIPSKQNYR